MVLSCLEEGQSVGSEWRTKRHLHGCGIRPCLSVAPYFGPGTSLSADWDAGEGRAELELYPWKSLNYVIRQHRSLIQAQVVSLDTNSCGCRPSSLPPSHHFALISIFPRLILNFLLIACRCGANSFSLDFLFFFLAVLAIEA